MTRNRTLLVVVVALAGALLWYVALFGPARSERLALAAKVALAEDQEQALHATRAQLRRLAAGQGAQQAQLERVQRLVPAQADVAGFILSANDAAVRSGVDWLSVAPANAVAGAAGAPSTIAVSLAVDGGFFTIVDYLRRLEGLERLVVVDSLQLSSGAGATGLTQLSATISARIFTTAPVPRAPGSREPRPLDDGGPTSAAAAAEGGG